jgi:hypothetical protein
VLAANDIVSIQNVLKPCILGSLLEYAQIVGVANVLRHVLSMSKSAHLQDLHLNSKHLVDLNLASQNLDRRTWIKTKAEQSSFIIPALA